MLTFNVCTATNKTISREKKYLSLVFNTAKLFILFAGGITKMLSNHYEQVNTPSLRVSLCPRASVLKKAYTIRVQRRQRHGFNTEAQGHRGTRRVTW